MFAACWVARTESAARRGREVEGTNRVVLRDGTDDLRPLNKFDLLLVLVSLPNDVPLNLFNPDELFVSLPMDMDLNIPLLRSSLL